MDDEIDHASVEANFLLSLQETQLGYTQKQVRRARLRNRPIAPSGKEALYSDKEAFMDKVRRNPFALEFASDELRANHEVVLLAVTENGSSLQYASASLQAIPLN